MFYEMLGTFQLSGTQTPSGQSEKDVLNNEGGTAPSTQEIPVPVDSTNDKPALQPAITQADIPEPVTQEAISPETAQEPATQEIPAGFSKIQSATFGFSMEYPKSWYYSGSASSETGVVRHYEFGTKPLEETPGQVSLDLMSGSLPAGIPTEINKIQIVKILSGDNIEYYAKGAGSRIYRITGPSSTANTLLQMAASIEE
jgi:hypothetical protein